MKFNNAPLSGLSCSSRKESGTTLDTCPRLRGFPADIAVFKEDLRVERGTKATHSPAVSFSQTERGETTLFGGVSFYSGEQLTRSHISPSPRFFTAAVFNCIRERKREREIFGITNFMGRKGSLFREGGRRGSERSLLVRRREGGRGKSGWIRCE